jgi:hypothetical protein
MYNLKYCTLYTGDRSYIYSDKRHIKVKLSTEHSTLDDQDRCEEGVCVCESEREDK